VFPIVHGRGGEDGSLQGLLELAEIPYVGSGVLGSAIQMDKEVSKRLLAAAGLPILPYICVRASELARDSRGCAERVLAALRLPVFVKPANLGSSVGIHKVKAAAELVAQPAEHIEQLRLAVVAAVGAIRAVVGVVHLSGVHGAVGNAELARHAQRHLAVRLRIRRRQRRHRERGVAERAVGRVRQIARVDAARVRHEYASRAAQPVLERAIFPLEIRRDGRHDWPG